MLIRLLALAALAAALLSAPLSAQDISGRASVVDGDTIEVGATRVQLFGVDAPEGQQLCERPDGETWRCGQQAALALSDKLGEAAVSCRGRTRDRDGAMVAVCFLGEEDINGWLVREGWAVAYRRYALDYADEEATARENKAGIWDSAFVMPWDWRDMRRKAGPGATMSGDCQSEDFGREGRRAIHRAAPDHCVR